MSKCLYVHTNVDGNEASVLESLLSSVLASDTQMDENIVVIVPSSMTLAYERAIVNKFNYHGFMNIRVVSEVGLPSIVFEQAGYGPNHSEPNIIDDSVMLVRVYSILKELDSAKGNGIISSSSLQNTALPVESSSSDTSLNNFDSSSDNASSHFISLQSEIDSSFTGLKFFHNQNPVTASQRVKEAIDELDNHGYNSAVIDYLLSSPNIPPLLKNKLEDLGKVMSMLPARNSDNDMYESDVWRLLLTQIRSCPSFINSHVFFFGFNGLSSRYIELGNSLLLVAKSVHYCLQDFYTDDLVALLTNYKLPYVRIDSKNVPMEDSNPAIIKLGNDCLPSHISTTSERKTNLSSTKKASYQKKDLECISCYQASSQYIECVFAVQKLIEWHKNHGYDWNEMGIVVPNESPSIMAILPQIMQASGIPYYSRVTKPLILTGCASFLKHTVDAISNNFKKESMLGILKSGYSCLNKDESMRFMNYVSQYNLEGKKWFQPISARGYISEDDASELNEMRLKIITPLKELHDNLINRKASASSQAELIYYYLIDNNIYELLKKEESDYRINNMPVEADFIRQTWDAVLKCINTIVIGAHKNKHISMEAMCAFISLSMSNEQIKFIPQVANAVLVDHPQACIPGQLKASVVVGLQDESISERLSLFSASDRMWLDKSTSEDFHVAPMTSIIENKSSVSQSINMYRSIVSATDHLCFTCSILSLDGKPARASSIFNHVVNILKKYGLHANIGGGIFSNDIKPFCKDITIEFLSDKLRKLKDFNNDSLSVDGTSETDILWKKALAYLQKKEPKAVTPLLSALNAKVYAENIPSTLAQKLYLSNVTSISELESFAACPYKHFISHGIRPVEVRDYAFQADMKGNFYHAAMKAYFEIAMKDPDFPFFKKSKIVNIYNKAIEPLLPELLDGALGESTLSRMTANEYIQDVRASAIYITYWLAKTKFKPVGCEARFGTKDSSLPPLILPVGTRNVSLKGIIDRYDVFTNASGQSFVRVIDYKSSPHVLDAEAVEGGYQLQLPLYLSELISAIPGVLPAGAYYQQIQNPSVDCDSDDEDEIRSKTMELVKINGVTLQNDDILDALGSSIKGSRANSKSLSSLDISGMKEMLDNAKNKAIEHVENMDKGIISIHPVEVCKTNPCKYCKSKELCGIDPRLSGGCLFDVNGRPIASTK